jgi:outer membrane protein OmpA-like peptidoglycan-associated protein
MKQKLVVLGVWMLCLAMLLGLSGCTCVQRGTAIGAGVGAVPGAIIGSFSADAGKGALIGAGGGAILGALVADGMCKPNPSDEIDNLKNQIALLTEENANLRKVKPEQVTAKGVEFVIEGDVLFKSGSDAITPKGIEILAGLADKIRKEYPGKALNIEGYTDNVAIAESPWKSNWELGSGRSLSVLHYMIEKQNFAAATLSATTFGEFRPVKANDGAENRQLNRRAVIVVSLK